VIPEAPNINLARDGRWGRIGETSGEDVLLTTRYMLAWVRGLQRGGAGGPDQALATCKHWSGYSLEGQIKPTATGPPGTYPSRHQFDAVVSKQDLVDFYFPVFESCAKDADVASVMCSYNSVSVEGETSGSGVPSCANGQFNDGILRAKWNFSGLMVSDWWVNGLLLAAFRHKSTPFLSF
jgi:beta-D-xylosidase 4